MSEVRICTRCVLDTTAEDIWFDDKGECKYCKIHDAMEERFPLNENSERRLQELVEEIKAAGKNKKHDCIVGVSGGRDSTYSLYTAVKLGLRPLAVHFDNGWNSEIAVSNIKNATSKLGADLHTVVADWEEFKDLQIAFLRASVPDAEVPTDYVIYSVLYRVADEEGLKYIINGHSFRTEGTSPISWTYMDGRYIRAIHKRFGRLKKIKSFPLMTLSELLYFVFLKRIKEIRLMEYIDYRKKEVDKILEKDLGWRYYGGHHHESVYTEFFQSYLLPKKFKIDKRKTENSALVRSGQMSRQEALEEIQSTVYEHEQEIVEYTLSKLDLSQEDFQRIVEADVKSFQDYPSYFPLIKSLRYPIKIACKLHLLPYIFYLKYADHR
jgi:N-acetyl sugar amidotransferase